MANVRITKEDLMEASRATNKGKEDYRTGDTTIANVINEVTGGKIGGSVSAQLLSVYETIKPALKEGYQYFDEIDQLMARANKEYDTTTEDAQAAINSNRW